MYSWRWMILLLVLPTWILVSTASEPDEDDEDVTGDCKKLEEKKCPKGKGKSLEKGCETTMYFNCTADCSFSPRSLITGTSKNYIITTIYVCPTSTIIPTPTIVISKSIQINPSGIPITSTQDLGKVWTKITITPSFPVSSAVEGEEDGSASALSPRDKSEEEEDENEKNKNDDDDDDDESSSGDGSSDDEESSQEDENKDGKRITKSRRPSSTKRRPSLTLPVSRSTRIFKSDLSVFTSTLSSIQLTSDLKSGIKSTRTFSSQVRVTAEHVSTPSSKDLRSKTMHLIDDSKMFSSRPKASKTLVLSRTPSTLLAASSSSKSATPSVASHSISPSITSSMFHIVMKSKISSKLDNIGSIMSSKILFSSTLVPTSSSSTNTANSSTQLAQSNASSSSIISSATGSLFSTVIHSTITSKPDMSSKMLFPSTLVATSVNFSSTSSATPPLSASLSSESSISFSSTPVVSSSSREQSIVNSSLPVSSVNVTLQTSSLITPARSTTVVVTSSVKDTQGQTVFCGESKTGEKFEKGILSWQKTQIGTRANTSCPYNKERIAYRWCRKNMTSIAPYWDKVHDEYCVVLEKNKTIDEIRKVTVTEENEERLAVLADYLTSHSNATVDLVKGGADLLEKLVVEAKNLWKIRKELLNSVSNVMNAPPAVLAQASVKHNSTARILKFVGQMMDEMNLTGRNLVRENSTNLVAEAWDVANVSDKRTFKTVAPEDEKNGASLVSVTLPASLLQRYKQKRRITFLNFMNDKLFPQKMDQTMTFINSMIVSANVKGDEVKNLSDPVVMEFRLTNRSFANNCSCVFWDFEANDGQGSWSSNGCDYEVIGDGLSRCTCTHLTHFGVLVNLFPNEEIPHTDKLILEGITFVGCYLSIVGLLLTVITLLSFKQYRNGVSGQILLNLCLALMFSMVIFLGGIKQVDDEATCVAMAALLHYFVLVAMLWMGVEAFHMFVNIVLDRLRGELGRVFVLKCAVVAWIVPMLIVVITVLVNMDDYKNEQYCRVKGNSFYIAFLGPGITIMLFNVIVFFLVVKSLLNTRIHSNRHKQGMVHFRRVLGIAVVFGITWLFGVLAVGELRLIFQYLFCITNAFQGFLIFILYCLTDRKVREKLVRFLCVLQDPNTNRIIDSTTSTQRPTDIEIDLSMFQERVPSNRPRDWSGTWPRTAHLTNSNPAWITQEIAGAPTHMFSPSAGYPSNRVIETEDDVPYYFPYPTGSRPVANIPLPGEIGGDKLVESTMSQFNLEQSGGEKSLRSADGSIIFINNGQRVEVPRYTALDVKELPGSNNNWEESPTRMHEIPLDRSMLNESSFEEPRRYSKSGDGLSFYKRGPRRTRHSSAKTSIEMSRRKTPTDRDYGKKGVHFSADELTISPDGSDNLPRWSEVGWFPQMISHTRSLQDGTIQEHDELDGTSLPRVEHGLRRTKSAKPSVAVTADDDVELDYYRRCQNDCGNEDDIASSYLAASKSRNFRRMARATDESQDRTQVNNKVRQSSDSSSDSSETSSNASFRWSEAGHAPSLKSYSQTTVSDVNSGDSPGKGNETHFTQF